MEPRRRQKQSSDEEVFAFNRKKRKINVSVPIDPDTVDLLKNFANQYHVSRCELMRYAVEFAIKNPVFHESVRQLT